MPNDALKKPPMHRLAQLLLDNKGVERVVRSESKDDEATIYLYDMIDEYWGISAQAFVKELNAIDAKVIHLRVNSPGGDVFAARAMVTAIRGHKSKIVAHIDGVAASAASWIALAAGDVEISQGAFLMIHNSMSLAWGNKELLRNIADLLEKVDASIIADYERKTKKSTDQIAEWMANETWFTADEAKAAGFVDRVVDGVAADNRWNLSAYDKAPKVEQPKDTLDADIARVLGRTEKSMRLIERNGKTSSQSPA